MIPMTRFKSVAAASLAVSLLLSAGARAQTVDVPYQGWLTQGELPCDGDYSMVFSLYDDPTSAAVRWSDTYNVHVSSGAFSVALLVPEAVITGYQALYLGITVEGVDLVNRQRIYPAIYAARNIPGMEFWVDNLLRFPAQVGQKIVFYESSAGYWAIEIHPDTLALYTQSPTDLPTMVLKSNGRVGIGTTAPQRRLHVTDDMQLDGSLYVQGRVTWQCPAGTIRIGTNCVSSEFRLAYQWAEANQDCHNRGMELCSLNTLMMCYLSGRSEVMNQDQCAWAIVQGHDIWTSDFDARDGTDLLNSAIVIQAGASYVRSAVVGAANHFCCMPVSP